MVTLKDDMILHKHKENKKNRKIEAPNKYLEELTKRIGYHFLW